MIKVKLSCRQCEVNVSDEISYAESLPYWGWRMWKSAIALGWVRQHDEVFCPNCKSQLDEPSENVLPVEPLPFCGHVQCDTCSSQFEKGKVSIYEHFARDIRSAARSQGWRFISTDGGQKYQDYCDRCEPDDFGKQRLALMELVWSMPTVRVASDLGVSDKAIEKRCKRLNIPKPPPGFWAKFRAGYIDECLDLIPYEVKVALGDELLTSVYRTIDE